MITFTPLASSSAGNCYVLESDDRRLLIDAGISIRDIQVGTSFQISRLEGALISHAHGDHAKSVRDLIRSGVDCYASKETWDELGVKDHRAKIMLAGQSYKIDIYWTITPFEVPHDSPGTFGFVVDSMEGERLLYLTDAAYSKFTFPGLTHIAIECNFSEKLLRDNALEGKVDGGRHRRTSFTHMSLERLIPMLKANDLSKVEWIMLLHLSDQNSDERMFKEEVQKATGIPTYVAPKRAVVA